MESLGFLIQQHLKANGLTQSQLAAHLNISVPYMSQIINGVRTPGKAMLPVIAQFLGVHRDKIDVLAAFENEKNPVIKQYLSEMYRLHWGHDAAGEAARETEAFQSDDGRMYRFDSLPVLGYCEAGVQGLWDPDAYPKGEGMFRVSRPPDITDAQAVAFAIRGDSMSPRFEEGDVVIVSPREVVRDGDYVVVRLTSTGEIMAKRIRFNKGFIVLESVNPSVSPVIIQDRADMAFCYRIVHLRLMNAGTPRS